MPDANINPLQSIIEALLRQAKPRPDITGTQTLGRESPISPATPVATYAGRVITPGDDITSILARFPQGVAGEEEAMAPAVSQVLPRFALAGTVAEIAKKLKGKFLTKAVTKEGLPQVVYHGTPTAFSEFDVGKSKPGLYGKGIYLTDAPDVSEGYAQGAFPRTAADAEKSIAYWKTQIANAKKVGDEFLEKTAREQLSQWEAWNPNVRPSFVRIKKPFDIDASYSPVEADRIAQIRTDKPLSGQQIFDRLRSTFSDEDAVTDILRQAGYDGITHIGGKVSGGKPHRVWIAFDPSQVVSVFDPSIQVKSK